MLDAMLETPMSEILEKIPLDAETKAVLRGEPSLLRPIYQLMLAHESGEWDAGSCDLRWTPYGSRHGGDFVLAGAAVGARSFQRGVGRAWHSGFRHSDMAYRHAETTGMSSCAKPVHFATCALGAGRVPLGCSHWPRSRVGLPRPRPFPAARRIRQRITDTQTFIFCSPIRVCFTGERLIKIAPRLRSSPTRSSACRVDLLPRRYSRNSRANVCPSGRTARGERPAGNGGSANVPESAATNGEP